MVRKPKRLTDEQFEHMKAHYSPDNDVPFDETTMLGRYDW